MYAHEGGQAEEKGVTKTVGDKVKKGDLTKQHGKEEASGQREEPSQEVVAQLSQLIANQDMMLKQQGNMLKAQAEQLQSIYEKMAMQEHHFTEGDTKTKDPSVTSKEYTQEPKHGKSTREDRDHRLIDQGGPHIGQSTNQDQHKNEYSLGESNDLNEGGIKAEMPASPPNQSANVRKVKEGGREGIGLLHQSTRTTRDINYVTPFATRVKRMSLDGPKAATKDLPKDNGQAT
jgi:hypothetical protein